MHYYPFLLDIIITTIYLLAIFAMSIIEVILLLIIPIIQLFLQSIPFVIVIIRGKPLSV